MIEQLKIYDVKSPKVRLGNDCDGGYVLPQILLDASSALFTYGVGTDIAFEVDYVKKTNKPVYLFDHLCQPPVINGEFSNLIFFKGEGLSYKKDDTCDTFLNHKLKNNVTQPVLLKIDIEGDEFNFFKNVDLKSLADNAYGIILEFHPNPEKGLLWEDFFKILSNINQHFYLSHFHGNNYGGSYVHTENGVDFRIPSIMEMTFVNKNLANLFNTLQRTTVSLDMSDFPNPLVDRLNDWNKPDHSLAFLKMVNLLEFTSLNNVEPEFKTSNEQESIVPANTSSDIDVNEIIKNCNIFISLTTVPMRMNLWESFKQNLTSLVNQKTDKEYRVLLNIPYRYANNNNEDYLISSELKQFAKENPRLIINRVENDYGPVVKITGALEVVKNPNAVLIILDDDHFYHEDMLEYHLKKMAQYPDSIITFRGDSCIEKREWVEDGVMKYTLSPTHFYFPVKNDSRLIVPGHWHSASYKRSYFGDDFYDDHFLNCSVNDDYVSGYYFRLKGIPFICAKWDNETDWRPVNDNGRGSHSFPILYQLPYPSSGFNVFREQINHHNGKTRQYVYDEMQQHNHRIYTEPLKPRTDSVNAKVIVTLTTIPTRVSQEHDSGIKSNLLSLINQDYNGEYEIHLNIPKELKYNNQPYIIPDWMRKLSEENPKFKIFEGLKDYGPITKLVPTLERITDGETIIIVCDDDLVYHPKMVEEQVKNQLKYEDTAVGYDGSRLVNPNDFDDVRSNFVVSVYKDVYVKLLQHYKTVSYKRKFFKEDFFNEFILDIKDAWNDDVVVSAYMGKHNYKKLVRCYEGEEPLITLEDWQAKGGVTTFPVLRHTSHEGAEGCHLYRRDGYSDNHMEYGRLNYI